MRRRLLERYPRLTASGTAPQNLDKVICTLVQKRKNILSHDRFLAKLQCFASDALGPLTYLLSELQAGKDVHKDVAISALLQAAIYLSGIAILSVEHRRYVLQQLNHQLVLLAEEEYELSGKLFGNDIGERAKSRVDAICSLSRLASVFFLAGQPPCAQQIQTGPWGSRKRPSEQVDTLLVKRRTIGKAGFSGPGRQKVSKKVTPEQKLTLSLQIQKRLYPTKVDIQPDIAMQPPPPSSMSLPRWSSTIRPTQPSEDPAPEPKGGRFTPQHNCRLTEALPRGVEQAITRQVDSSDNIPLLATPVQRPSQLPVMNMEMSLILNRELQSLLSRGIIVRSGITSLTSRTYVCVSSVYYSEKERKASVNSEPKSIESTCPKAAFQNGESPHVTRHPPSAGLDGENRFKRGILCSSCPPWLSRISQFPVESDPVPIHVPPLWPVMCPTDFLQKWWNW